MCVCVCVCVCCVCVCYTLILFIIVTSGPSAQTKKPNVKNRRQKHEWTFLEEEYLRKGVKLFGVGSWMKIRRNFPFPDYRTNVDLKDKWRCLERRK